MSLTEPGAVSPGHQPVHVISAESVHGPQVVAQGGHDAERPAAHRTPGEPLVLLHVVQPAHQRPVHAAADRARKMAAAACRHKMAAAAVALRHKMAAACRQKRNVAQSDVNSRCEEIQCALESSPLDFSNATSFDHKGHRVVIISLTLVFDPRNRMRSLFQIRRHFFRSRVIT